MAENNKENRARLISAYLHLFTHDDLIEFVRRRMDWEFKFDSEEFELTWDMTIGNLPILEQLQKYPEGTRSGGKVRSAIAFAREEAKTLNLEEKLRLRRVAPKWDMQSTLRDDN